MSPANIGKLQLKRETEMQLLKKITVGGINEVRGGFNIPTETTHVARLFGLARTVETKESNFGPYLRFKGDFRAVNEDGEEFSAPVMMLPSPADGLLASAIEGDNGSGVAFAFDVFLQPVPVKKPGDRGYEYRVKPLMDTETSDPLKAIASVLPPLEKKPKQEALPLPTTPDVPAAAPVAEPEKAPAAPKKK